VLTATGIRAGELAGIRYDPREPSRSDLDLWRREIRVRGKGGREGGCLQDWLGIADAVRVRPLPLPSP
jgi:hypothetical protein